MLPIARFFPITTVPVPLRTESGVKVEDTASARATDTAQELEATFLSLLLKEMRQTLEADGGLFPGDTGDVQGGLFDLYLGKHLADSGGVGLAVSIDRQLKSAYAPATGHGNPLPRGSVVGATFG